MKHHFVKTENLKKLLAAAAFMGERGSLSSPLCLMHGDPGVGKSRNISYYGAEKGAVLVKGHVGQNLDGLIWSISQQLGVKHKSNRSAEMGEQIAAFRDLRAPIIYDEAQFGIFMRWQKVPAAGIEYIRQLGEAAGEFVFLVCHNSEVVKFSDSPHISNRIAHRVELHNADENDTLAFVLQLCEVDIGEGVGQFIHAQTGGKYRLIENAIAAVERIAKVKGKRRVVVEDLAGITLVVDHVKGLVPKIASTKKSRSG